MHLDFEHFVATNDSYSIANAIREGIDYEDDHAYLDLAPIEPLNPPTAQEEIELQRAYDAFYGTSPLNSPSPSPSSSRPSSPDPAAWERELDKSFGASPLSSVPASPTASSPLPNAETQSKPTGSAAAASSIALSSPLPNVAIRSKLAGTGPNSKTRQRKKNSHTNRRHRRQTERSQVDKNASPHPNGWKHIAQAEATGTAYNTSDIPSASSGFIALPDRGPGVCPATEELLKDPRFQYIRWRGRFVHP